MSSLAVTAVLLIEVAVEVVGAVGLAVTPVAVLGPRVPLPEGAERVSVLTRGIVPLGTPVVVALVEAPLAGPSAPSRATPAVAGAAVCRLADAVRVLGPPPRVASQPELTVLAAGRRPTGAGWLAAGVVIAEEVARTVDTSAVPIAAPLAIPLAPPCVATLREALARRPLR